MLIFAIDDERPLLNEAQLAIAEAVPEAEIMLFLSAEEALRVIKSRKLFPTLVFCDVEMPGLSGLEFAVELKIVSPDTRVVFVTAYAKYAVDAFKTRAHGYILKPLRPDLVKTELSYLPPALMQNRDKLTVRCFGYFEVFWQGEPVRFERRQTKELFAFLIDRRGASCTAEDIGAALWEDSGGAKNTKQRIRNLINDLKTTLETIGMGDVLLRQGSRIAIRPDCVYCDYYRMLAGDMDAVNCFRGEYMTDYSWAELTAGTLFFRNTGKDK